MLISIPEGVPWVMTQHKERGMQVHVWIGKSRIAGKGLFAGQDIKKGTTIIRILALRFLKNKPHENWPKGMPTFVI